MRTALRLPRRRGWISILLAGLLVALALATLMFGVRTYRSYQVLHSAQELGASDVGSLRGWMTLRYVAATYGISAEALAERLHLPPEVDPNTSLRTLARRQGRDPLDFIRDVQRAIIELRPAAPVPAGGSAP